MRIFKKKKNSAIKKKITRQQRRAVKNIKADKQNRFYDFGLLAVIIFLMCFGFVMVFSASSSLGILKNQMLWGFIGIGAMLFVSIFDYHWLEKFAVLGLFLAIILMVLVDFTPFGIESHGQKRWFGIAGHSLFQAAEPVKVAIILWTAEMCTYYRKNSGKVRMLFAIGVPAAVPTLLVMKNNLSSGIILAGIVILVLFVWSKLRVIFGAAAAAIIAAVVFIYQNVEMLAEKEILFHAYQYDRILVWKDPLSYSSEGGYQVLQGLYAIGSGGLFGKGLGQSMQKLGYVPESQNDMVFSIICEELGVFGAACVVGLFLFLIWRCVVIANNAPDLFGSLLVTGVMAHVSLQVILNIAVVTNTIPNTGITLPFISSGGASLFFMLLEMGVVLSVSNRIIYKK